MSTISTRSGGDYLSVATKPEDILTPEDMNDEQRMMMQAIRDFAERDVAPVADKVDERDIGVIRPLFEKAAELGIFLAEVPEEYGGLNIDALGVAGMMESRAHLGSMGSTIFAHQGIGTLPLINFGTQDQIDRYLEKCTNGTYIAGFALTEPSSGSDAMNIKTTAVLNDAGTHYIVNGSKQFITNAGYADIFILFAKVDGEQFTAFILERNSDGVEVGDNEKLLGLHGSSVCPLTLTDVAIPVENLLGEIGRGHRVAMCTLNLGRLKMGTYCVGSAKKLLACASQYAAERFQFGQPIAEFGIIQEKIAVMAARLFGTQCAAYRTAGMVYHAAQASGGGSLEAKLNALAEFAIECAMTKVHGSEMLNSAADEALQIHGGYGFSEEFMPARAYRDSRITRIYEGTSEICRISSMKHLARKQARGGLVLDRYDAPASRPKTNIEAAHAMKSVFSRLWTDVREEFGAEGMFEPAQQPFIGALATIAIETYVSESVALRVDKLRATLGDKASLHAQLGRIYIDRSAEIVRDQARLIAAGLHEGEALSAELARFRDFFPLPINRIAMSIEVAKDIVARKGILPDLQLI